MNSLTGKTVFAGIAIGRIKLHKKETGVVRRYKISDIPTELKRLETALDKTDSELEALYNKALSEVGESGADIFDVHRMMLKDQDYLDSINNIISGEKVNAEFAVAVTADNFAKMFSSMEDEYFKARAADIKDISERLISVLKGGAGADEASSEPVILAAEDLSPSETVQLDKSKILAFVTKYGSSNSHTAILARTMNIPALIGVDFDEEQTDGAQAIVDGIKGKLIIDPDGETLEKYKKLKQEEEEKARLLLEMKGKETVTKSGRKIRLYSNIGGTGDLPAVLENDAEGIGLFRSEFLYLEKDNYPTEEEQFDVYKTVVQAMAGKLVIIRTLDIGADKQIGYFDLEKEDNPAMGYRAIRICLDRPEIFKTQLRALYRASAYGNIGIMFPMIISVDEVKKIKKIAESVKAGLKADGISIGSVELGVMIETPAAVMISDDLAKEVDFFSIGTNDLTQYTLAIDRQNRRLDNIYDPHHPAILKMIKTVVDNAHKHDTWVGICGELGADLSLTETFVKMGIDELSVSPNFILPLRKTIINMQ